jgi:DNA-binding transcriptional regulator of glucitol operon
MSLNYSIVILALAFGIAFQLLLTGWQTKRFYARLKDIRKNGEASIGLEGGMWSGKTYAVLVVDEKKNVLHAEKMSGVTIFAKLQPVPVFEGLHIDEILDENRTFKVSKKLLRAFRNSAREFYKDTDQLGSTIENHQIKSVKIKGEKKS